MSETTPVLVTTAQRGVFYGRLEEYETERTSRTVRLHNCRNVIEWKGSGGCFAMALLGPEEGSRIGAPAPETTLQDVTSISRCHPDAERKFEAWPYSD